MMPLIGRKLWLLPAVMGGAFLLGTLGYLADRAGGADNQDAGVGGHRNTTDARPGVPATDAKSTVTLVSLQQRFETSVKPLLAQHCYRCHGNGKTKGDLSLDPYTSLQSIQKDRKTWKHISDVLTQRTMPPESRPQPKDQEYATLTGWIDDALNFCDCSGPRDPGRVAIHRLNRTEYNNTLRDLLGVDIQPAKDFPADDSGYGFDNIADVLSMSPLLAEKYLAAAEQALDRALSTENPYASKKQNHKKLEASGGTNVSGDLTQNGEAFTTFDFACDGRYEIHVMAGQDPFGNEPAKMVLKLDDRKLKSYDVANRRSKPKLYSYEFQGKAGKHKVATAYINNKVDQTNSDPKKRGDRNLYIDSIELEGPFNVPAPPPSEAFQRLMFVKPGAGVSDDSVARLLLERFASRAYRRPVATDEVSSLVKLYRAGRQENEPFDQGLKLAMSGVLVSPQFLYRIEVDPTGAPAGTVHRLSDFELATRLSYFLWSSTPDEALMSLAKAGKLHQPAVLGAEVKRMLADPKAEALVTNFAGQWLELRALDDTKRDGSAYPKFNNGLRADMKRETEMFFQTIVKEDRSVLDLIGADYTFVNERLAKLYGIDNVKGKEFRKVSLAGTHRGGVLTHASVLTVTAMPSRTSPMKRGKFLLDQILGTPLPPPPPDVPALDEKPQSIQSASLRQRLEQHRANPSCAVCHKVLDPLGFAMENFDAIGGWRDKDGSFAIDASGTLPDGTSVSGPEDLRNVILSHKHEFVLCLSEKMLTYALGRGMEYYDQCTMKDIAATVENANFRFSGLIQGIVQSDAFQKRRTATADELKAEMPAKKAAPDDAAKKLAR